MGKMGGLFVMSGQQKNRRKPKTVVHLKRIATGKIVDSNVGDSAIRIRQTHHDANRASVGSTVDLYEQRVNVKKPGGCEHGRRRSQCKECGGSQICEHDRMRAQCKECVGAGICSHGRMRSRCKECGGSQICEHGRRRSRCKECGAASTNENAATIGIVCK